jgi:hypothetical protein
MRQCGKREYYLKLYSLAQLEGVGKGLRRLRGLAPGSSEGRLAAMAVIPFRQRRSFSGWPIILGAVATAFLAFVRRWRLNAHAVSSGSAPLSAPLNSNRRSCGDKLTSRSSKRALPTT